jgi:hypothetical protein
MLARELREWTRIQIADTCHSERSEESMMMFAGESDAGYFASLRMTEEVGLDRIRVHWRD